MQFVAPGVAAHIVTSTFGRESELKNSALKRCAAAATVVAGLLSSVSVQAVVYGGSWDPTFDLSDANFGLSGGSGIQLGWRGHFLGDVSAFCSPGGGTGLVVVGTGEGCAASLSSAVVDLYAETDPGKATIASIAFDLSPPGYLNVLALLYDDGVLKQLRTTASGLDLATYVPEGSVYGSIDTSALRWQLVFDFLDPIISDAASSAAAVYSGPQLSYAWPGCPGSSAFDQSCVGANSSDFAPTLVISPSAPTVPEPAGTALALVALAAWAVTRRRPAQALIALA